MKDLFSIRVITSSDIPKLNKLFQETILTINRKDYSIEEVEDWASCGDNVSWHELFTEQHYILAENHEGEIVGFASINDIGYLHTMFVHKDFQHQGIATLLYQTLEKYAKKKGAEEITSEISITAKPFFEKQGFSVNEEQKRKANRLSLTNYKMSKRLK
ncbi:GNAT family N-acetyltransferase [Dysgonomonas sp.]